MQPPAETGRLLDGRYRLGELRHSAATGGLWRATDQVLGREVAIRLLTGASEADRDALIAAAGRAGQVPDARWVRVLDIGSEPDGDALTIWLVSEWVDGPTLAATIRQDPLRGPAATALLLSCALAVGAAQRHGASHGRLHPDEVLLSADGNPRITGLELARALHAGQTEPALAVDDTRALGGLLYAALTGRWPLPGWPGLPAPTRGDGRHPRRQRAWISRDLDEVTARALSGDYPDAAAFARDLAALPTAPLRPAPSDPDKANDPRWRRIAWRVVPPVLVAAIGLAAWLAGSRLGQVPGPARAVAPSFPQPRQSAGTSAGQVVWSTPPRITSFDPDGDGAEDPGGVGLAVDDDPSTSWSTDTYRGSAEFGGLKPGVGLLLDLRRPERVDSIELLLSAPGATVQIRAGAVAPRRPTDLPIVTSRADSAAAVHLALAKPVTAKYWLLWITTLPKVGTDSYRLGVAEIALLR